MIGGRLAAGDLSSKEFTLPILRYRKYVHVTALGLARPRKGTRDRCTLYREGEFADHFIRFDPGVSFAKIFCSQRSEILA